jgi:hypothetical protein
MAIHDFVDISAVYKGVPNRLGIHHRHRATSASVQTTGFVDTHLAGAIAVCVADALLAAVKPGLRLMLCATLFAAFTFIQAEKNMALVIAGVCGWRSGWDGSHTPILGSLLLVRIRPSTSAMAA